MNLAWLAAVLEPRDVAPHPNFSDDMYDARSAPRLAAVILGDGWRLNRLDRVEAASNDDVAVLADRCLRTETIAVAVPVLAERLIEGAYRDEAQATALALLTCAAAAELDAFDTCFHVLNKIMAAIAHVRGPDGVLLRAALLQQLSLRRRDAGLPHEELSIEAWRLLRDLDATALSTFESGRGISWTSDVTTEHIRLNLLDAAAASMQFAWDDDSASREDDLPTWQDRVRRPLTSLGANAARFRAEAYEEHAKTEFEQLFGTGSTRRFGGSPTPDVFRALLLLELHGHPAVNGLREELALWRLVRGSGGAQEVADALRLLRQASSKDNLDRALRRVAYEGPLAALSLDARQILRARLPVPRLRAPELRVLATAADVLAAPEARMAFDALLTALAEDGPRLVPGTRWQLAVSRKEPAWIALAALSSTCGASDEAAGVLLSEVAKLTDEDDQLVASAIRRALVRLNLRDVSERQRMMWISYVRDATEKGNLRATVEDVFGMAATGPRTAMEALVDRVNAAVTGEAVLETLAPDELQLLIDGMSGVRDAAARGVYSFGGVSAAELAAAVLQFVDEAILWNTIAEFLLDPRVLREHKGSAFDRLARRTRAIPQSVAAMFADQGVELMRDTKPNDPMAPTPLVPNPAILRFLAAHSILGDAEMFDALAALAGSGRSDGRREAAISIGVIAGARPMAELLALTLPLARDSDVQTRAHAGRALALLANDDSPLASAAEYSLYELLSQDGALAPQLVLSQLTAIAGGLTPVLHAQIVQMAQNHPSRAVRAAATEMLQATS